MTVALYARRKAWPLEGVTVRRQHSRIHASDCAECETKEGKLDRIDGELVLAGSLTQEQRTRLLQIGERCLVHRTLTSKVDVRSRLAWPGGGVDDRARAPVRPASAGLLAACDDGRDDRPLGL